MSSANGLLRVNSELLFVYGSLRRGFEAQGLLRRLGARCFGKGSVYGRLFDLGRFPGAVQAPRCRARVVGELYILRGATRSLRLLDRFEGSGYRRELAEVELRNGKRARAWVYWLKGLGASKRLIRSGDYAEKRDEL